MHAVLNAEGERRELLNLLLSMYTQSRFPFFALVSRDILLPGNEVFNLSSANECWKLTLYIVGLAMAILTKVIFASARGSHLQHDDEVRHGARKRLSADVVFSTYTTNGTSHYYYECHMYTSSGFIV